MRPARSQQNHATMTSPLTDAEGFPLASLDIPAICAARKRIHELLNDRRAMDEQMAQWLEVAMREAPTGTQRDQAAVGPPASADAPAPDNSDASARPVGVRSVAQNSPAAAAVRRSRRL